jgi:hypothetical protein
MPESPILALSAVIIQPLRAGSAVKLVKAARRIMLKRRKS